MVRKGREVVILNRLNVPLGNNQNVISRRYV